MRPGTVSFPATHGIGPASMGVLGLVALMATGCASSESFDGATELPLFRLSESPTVEIGVVEGDDDYTFGEIVSVVRLRDGSVAVSDAGATRISVFGPDGTFDRRWGSRGEGPGEFRGLSRIYPVGDDSILALDTWTERLSAFALDGAYGRQLNAEDVSQDSIFELDVWLYGRFWVDGALYPDERSRVRQALDRLPPPRSPPGYRVVRVGRDGRLWIREPEVGSDGARAWTLTDPDGTPSGVIRLPERFDPQDILSDEVLGRWLGENDVNFVRSYRVESTAETRDVPAWISTPQASDSDAPPPDEEEFMALIRGAIRGMASAQEIHYSTQMTYTTRTDSLEWDRPEGLEVDFVVANPRGWSGVFSHPGIDRICGLAYGFVIPPGWSPGEVTCAPSTSATTGEGR